MFLEFLRAFLKRKQYVSINGSNSSLLTNDHGVAQGSTLGPLLFLIYINDLPHSVNCIPRLFADDTCLVFSASTPTQLSAIMNKDLDNTSKWLYLNKLTVNPSKSNALIIPPKLNKPPPTIDLSLNNSPILISNSAKYLSVTINSFLKFDKHISIEHKISRVVGIISKLRHFLPTNALLNVCYAFIQLHLLYGLPIWGSSFPSHLKKLTVLQNKAIKVIGGGLPRDRATPFYYKLNILKLSDLFKLEIGKFVYAHFNNKLPFILSGYFSLTSEVSQKNTRSTLSRTNCFIYSSLPD